MQFHPMRDCLERWTGASAKQSAILNSRRGNEPTYVRIRMG